MVRFEKTTGCSCFTPSCPILTIFLFSLACLPSCLCCASHPHPRFLLIYWDLSEFQILSTSVEPRCAGCPLPIGTWFVLSFPHFELLGHIEASKAMSDSLGVMAKCGELRLYPACRISNDFDVAFRDLFFRGCLNRCFVHFYVCLCACVRVWLYTYSSDAYWFAVCLLLSPLLVWIPTIGGG